MSAVFFLAPAADTVLNPILKENETPVYRSFTAGELKNNVGRKWKYREGTLTNDKDIMEEKEEVLQFPTQDDFIKHHFKS